MVFLYLYIDISMFHLYYLYQRYGLSIYVDHLPTPDSRKVGPRPCARHSTATARSCAISWTPAPVRTAATGGWEKRWFKRDIYACIYIYIYIYTYDYGCLGYDYGLMWISSGKMHHFTRCNMV